MTEKQIEMAVDRVKGALDNEARPAKMSKQDALYAYEYMVSLCETSIDGLRDDIRTEKGNDR